MVSNNMLTRGNPFANKICIGGLTPLVPRLPGNIDGKQPGGIAKHGRFEERTPSLVIIGIFKKTFTIRYLPHRSPAQWDLMAFISDFAMQPSEPSDGIFAVRNLMANGSCGLSFSSSFLLGNEPYRSKYYMRAGKVNDLLSLKEFGDDGPDGNKTNIKSDQAANPEVGLCLTISVEASDSGQSAFLLTRVIHHLQFQVAKKLTSRRCPQRFCQWYYWESNITRHFLLLIRDQRFPENWFRPATQIVSATNGPIVAELLAGGCFAYWDQSRNTAGVLANTTGLFKKNVDLLEGFVFAASGCAEQLPPSGPTGV
ncbi:hypothetical protein B0H11DRAFT_1935320 [Mycena galericulata]|nr:hypothetical protein B0H11DRAFT_1935320 [Mycena galericulata]